MDYFVQLYGSKEALEKAAGKSYAQIREENRKGIEDQLRQKKALKRK